MRKAWHPRDRKDFWERYWQAVGRDVDEIADNSVYPLHPINGYLQDDDRILEAGCGLGRVLKHYHRRGRRIIGLEYDAFCLQTLHREDPTLALLRGSITDLPFPDGAFDVVMAFGVIGHIEDALDRALGESARVLRPGGLLAGSLCLDNLGRAIQGWAVERRVRREGQRHFYTHLLARAEIRAALAQQSLTVREMNPVHSREPLFAMPIFRKRGSAEQFSRQEARDAERGYRLNVLGEGLYRLLTTCLPWALAFTCSFVAQKREA